MVDFSGHLSPITVSADQRGAEAMTREADVRQALEKVSHTYGFTGFLVMVVPAKTCCSLADTVVMTNWPKDFLVNYDAANMMAGSPVIARLRRSTIPFTYDTTLDSHRRSDGKGNQVLSLFRTRQPEARCLYPGP
ncbi:autoinducer binding domain-containing protein [Rhizobium sp. RCAM05350]|nr:autoinducer binding domain-containing protein [Rhizobium sp. RCAM05350]